jgi:hypothetical protein
MPKAKTIPPMKDVVDQWLGRGAGEGAGGTTVVVFGAAVDVVLELKVWLSKFELR